VAPVDDPDGGDYPVPPENAVEELPEGSARASASPCGKACANLATLHCPEGSPTKAGISCYRGCLSMAKQQRLPTKCWTDATSIASVRACGGIRCLN